MNTFEARLKIHQSIRDVLVALGTDDRTTEEELLSLGEECSEIADILMEDLGLEVISVDDGTIHATISLYEPE